MDDRVLTVAAYGTVVAGLAVVLDGIIRGDSTDILLGAGLMGGPTLLESRHHKEDVDA